MQTELTLSATNNLETIPELPTLRTLECCDNQALPPTEEISTGENDLEAFRLFLLSGGKFHCSIRCNKEKLEKGEDCGC